MTYSGAKRIRWIRCGGSMAFVCFVCASAWVARGDDWPTYQHDPQRSGVTGDSVNPPLREVWRYRAIQPPQPAWPDPAKVDFARTGDEPLRPRTTYDRAFHVVIAGDQVFFGSSADDRVVALDAQTGEERWSFFTDGPVRLAPTVSLDKGLQPLVYVGSDDGRVYCLTAANGALVWKYRPAPEQRFIPGNGRLISACPIRTGVVVKDNTVYVAAGLFPEEGVYLCALDARTGAERWKQSPDPDEFIRRFITGQTGRRFALSPQGYLLASDRRLYVPTGRTSPVVVDPATGDIEALLDCPVGEGGTYALVTPDLIVSGPGTRLTAFDAATRDQLATFPGRLILVRDETSYLLFDDQLAALDRAKFRDVTSRRQTLNAERKPLAERLRILRKASEKSEDQIRETTNEIRTIDGALKVLDGFEYAWTTPCPESYAMILTADALFTGAENAVTAFQPSSGKQIWRGEVMGKAYGLAAANGRLLVSTDAGVIHCFAPGEGTDVRETEIRPETEPSPVDAVEAAQFIVDKTGVKQGYCLNLGCGNGRLACELARRTDLKIVAIDDDSKNVETVRSALAKTGLYGTRIAALPVTLTALPFPDYMANLIVSDALLSSGEPPYPTAEIARLLRPYGGMVCLRYGDAAAAKRWAESLAQHGCSIVVDQSPWIVLRRGPIPGSGEWTHAYADVANTACSSDQLVHAPTRLQWFGLPGPRPMVDRHHRAMPPLAKNGRMFVPGDSRVIAADAYNGTPLWEVEAPDSRRLAAPRDAGQMAVTEDLLYVAVQDACWALDTATGQRAATFPVPQRVAGEQRNWGYVASVDDLLFGSGQKVKATYTTMSAFGDHEIQWDDFKRIVTSDYLFCLDRHAGKEQWAHQNGLVIHPTITIGDGRMYFVESHSQKAKEDPGGRVTLDVLWADGPSMVALDVRTGARVWDQPADFSLCRHVIYLSYANGTLLALGSGNREDKAWYYLYAFDAATGAPLWKADHPNNKGGIGGDHGEQIHHPVIIGDVVFAEPVAYNLRTGARVNPAGEPAQWMLAPRESCGTLSGSASCLFYRDGHPCIQALEPDGARRKLNWITRPGCWINIIPAGGLILIPEASSGCSCPYPLQTSLAYAPQRKSG